MIRNVSSKVCWLHLEWSRICMEHEQTMHNLLAVFLIDEIDLYTHRYATAGGHFRAIRVERHLSPSYLSRLAESNSERLFFFPMDKP